MARTVRDDGFTVIADPKCSPAKSCGMVANSVQDEQARIRAIRQADPGNITKFVVGALKKEGLGSRATSRTITECVVDGSIYIAYDGHVRIMSGAGERIATSLGMKIKYSVRRPVTVTQLTLGLLSGVVW